MRQASMIIVVISTACACGARAVEPASKVPATAAATGSAVPPEHTPNAGPHRAQVVLKAETSGRIDRAELLPILDGGLGRFLQGVGTEPVLVHGRFVGFRLTKLWPDDPRFQGVDLKPGDVIVRINGQSIEHPEDALQVWNDLRVASELWIEYLRDGVHRELRFAIVN